MTDDNETIKVRNPAITATTPTIQIDGKSFKIRNPSFITTDHTSIEVKHYKPLEGAIIRRTWDLATEDGDKTDYALAIDFHKEIAPFGFSLTIEKNGAPVKLNNFDSVYDLSESEYNNLEKFVRTHEPRNRTIYAGSHTVRVAHVSPDIYLAVSAQINPEKATENTRLDLIELANQKMSEMRRGIWAGHDDMRIEHTPNNDHDVEQRNSAQMTLGYASDKVWNRISASDPEATTRCEEFDDLQKYHMRMAVEFCRKPQNDASSEILRLRTAKSLVYLLGESTPPDVHEMGIDCLLDKEHSFRNLKLQSRVEGSDFEKRVDNAALSSLILNQNEKSSDEIIAKGTELAMAALEQGYATNLDVDTIKTLIVIQKERTPPDVLSLGSSFAMGAVMDGNESDLDREVLTAIGSFKEASPEVKGAVTKNEEAKNTATRDGQSTIKDLNLYQERVRVPKPKVLPPQQKQNVLPHQKKKPKVLPKQKPKGPSWS